MMEVYPFRRSTTTLRRDISRGSASPASPLAPVECSFRPYAPLDTPSLSPGATSSGCLIEPLTQLLAGLEEWEVLLGNVHIDAGAWIAPDACLPPLHREG